MQIQEALGAFVIQLEADGRSAHTIGQYRRHILSLARWLGPRKETEDVSHGDLARFLSSDAVKEKRGCGPRKATSANAIRTSLCCFFAYLAGAQLIDGNPARVVRRARCSPPPPRSLSPEEETRLLQVLEKGKERDRMLFTLMLRTGIRLGSAVALDIQDLDIERGEIVLRHAKNDRVETVFLPRSVGEALQRFTRNRASGPVFAGPSGKRVSGRNVRRVFAQALERAGIERVRGTHALRHTLAMRLYERSGDLELVRAALHHRSIASTVIYARISPDRLRRELGA